ncbi:MAG: hypothetical protein FWG52_00790 [Proteobacteria bacterium]|nr:hypothetical protein [Pseudomonadota bacterium]
MKKSIFVVGVATFIGVATFTACSGKPFVMRPPPYEFEAWKKPGASEGDIKIALLECGYETPFSAGAQDINSLEIASRCMTKNGYVSSSRYFPCRGPNGRNIPACQLPDSEIPDRDVSKRLNSKFCKQFPKAQVCQ